MSELGPHIVEIRKRLRRAYRGKGSRGADKISPGEDLRRWIEKTRREGRALPDDIKLWLMFLDEALAFWLAVWGFYRELLEADANPPPAAARLICLMTLAGRVFQDIVCVRDLITAGFFVQSNVVLRSLIESIDIMHLVNLEPALADEFRAIAENDGATRFWHAHCSKNRIHKKIKQRWLWLFDGDKEAAASFHRLREDYLDLVGMSAHPTFPASFVTFMDSPSGIESDSIVRNALGQVSHMSKFSIHLLLLRIFEYGFLWSGPEISLYKNDEGAVESSLS